MSDLLSLQPAIDKLQAALNEQQSRVAALEAQTAKDATAVVEAVKTAVMPEVEKIRDSINTLILTLDASVNETLTVIRRVDGAQITVKLGPVPD